MDESPFTFLMMLESTKRCPGKSSVATMRRSLHGRHGRAVRRLGVGARGGGEGAIGAAAESLDGFGDDLAEQLQERRLSVGPRAREHEELARLA
eukprot:3551387-Pleurochrysis_carterae.AAC.1